MTDYIKREMLEKVEDHLEKDEISLIVGARQVGKTTLMQELRSQLKENGENTLFLSMDIQEDRTHFESQQDLIERVELEFGEEKGYVFLDEIQRKENAGLFLKGIYDRDLPYKFVVSGSGSLELKENIHETLAGRKRVFELAPVSFKEFVNYETDYEYEERLEKYFEVNKDETDRLLEKYLNYGGYPRVVTEQKESEKRRIIDEIFSSYLERDVSSFLNVRKVDAYSKLVSVLADQMGDPISNSKLARDVGVKSTTVRNYLDYLDKTFIVEQTNPFYTNKKKEITKSPIVYFSDLGLRNYSIQRFGHLNTPSEFGELFEGFIHNFLKQETQHTGLNVNYWRTKSQAEVDFILSAGNKVELPVEAKYRELSEPKVTKSMRSFIKKYSPEKAVVVNLSLEETVEIENTQVEFIPYTKFLYQLEELT
ncbi:AAA family ATPase [Candidatus Nanohaloarchaea archaeon]|nr:AAA family ATPase [Candidatus Nanohaloarchaea archaeon]